MGNPRDMIQQKTLSQVDDIKRHNRVQAAHDLIYKKNYSVNSAPVERLLQEESLVPTMVWYFKFIFQFTVILIHCQNTFSQQLGPYGFNMFDIVVVDLLHEVELGVWKALFIHLLRILDCQNESLKHELDRWWVFCKSYALIFIRSQVLRNPSFWSWCD